MTGIEDLAYRFVDQAVATWCAAGLRRELLAHALTSHGLAMLSEVEGPEVWAEHLEDLAECVRQMPNEPPAQWAC